MKNDALKIPTPRMSNKILHRLRCILGIQRTMHIAQRRMYHRAIREGRFARFGLGGGLVRGEGLFFSRGLFVEDVSV